MFKNVVSEETKEKMGKIIDDAINALEAQGGPALEFVKTRDGKVVGKICLYRLVTEAGGTEKCLVGHMISDEYYSCDLEKNDVDDTIVVNALLASGVPINEYENAGILSQLLVFLRKGQNIHDTCYQSENGHWLFNTIDNFSLDWSEVIQELRDWRNSPDAKGLIV